MEPWTRRRNLRTCMESRTSCSSKSSDLFPIRIQRHASEQHEKPALSFLDEHGVIQQSWTVDEIDRRARSTAAYLQDRGFTGKTIGLAYPSNLEFLAAFCGCLYAGAIAVPASLPRSHHADERMAAVLRDCDARFVLTTVRCLSNVE